MDPKQVWQDPDFQNLPDEEKHKVLTQIDPDYAGLPAGEQTKVLESAGVSRAMGSVPKPYFGQPSESAEPNSKVKPFSLDIPGPDQGVPQEPSSDTLGDLYANANTAANTVGDVAMGGVKKLDQQGVNISSHLPGNPGTRARQLRDSGVFQPKNTAERVGGIGTEAAEYLAPGLGEEGVAEGLATRGVPKLLSRALYGAGTNAAIEAANGGSGKDIGVAAGVGAGVPLAAKAAEPVVNRIRAEAPKLMQSVMNVLPKEFRYGRNPAKAVVDEGIKGNDIDEIYNQVAQRYTQRAQDVENNLQRNAHVDLDLTHHVLDPIEHAQNLAADQGNERVYNQLEQIKQRLGQKHAMFRVRPNEPPIHFYSGEVPGPTVTAPFRSFNTGSVDFSGFTPAEANAFKQRVGEMAKWTPAELTNPDSQAVNSALRQVYHNVNSSIDAAVPGTKLANQRVGELMSAKHALEIAKQKEEGSRSIVPEALKRVIRRGALIGSLGTLGGVYGGTGGRHEIGRDALLGAAVGGLGEAAAEPLMSATERPGFLSKMAQFTHNFPSANKFVRPFGAAAMTAYDESNAPAPPGATHIVRDKDGNVIGHIVNGNFVRQYTPPGSDE